MKSPTILIADNDDNYRKTVVEFLQRRGYSVIEASNPTDARRILEAGEVDIAVLDIRMENDDDINDDSGLRLAVKTAPQIPKIMSTAYPTTEWVRVALRQIGGQLPPASDFLDKGEGLEVLLSAITKIQPLPDIFIVHGHDEAARLAVKDYLTDLHLNPIILKDLVNAGQLLLEKLERASASTYAIVLLTPDDLCVLKNEDGKIEPRARQNVILEAGYFMARLGRERVCMLYVDGVVLPSDILGFVWIKMDCEGAWKIAVARELRAAGFSINLNDIL